MNLCPKKKKKKKKKKKHLPLINAALSGIKISTMMEVARSRVPDVHPLSYPLLQWIVSSNRSHLVKLSPEKFLPCMGTKFQFLLLSAPPVSGIVLLLPFY